MNRAGNRCSRSRRPRHHLSVLTRQLTNNTRRIASTTAALRYAGTSDSRTGVSLV
jgi:hypothetical protein